MPAVFTEAPGVAMVLDCPSLPAVVALGGWNRPARFKCALVGHALGAQGAQQFMQTLRDMIYVYTFGDRMMDFQMQGVTFLGVCPDDSRPSTGLDDLFDYYNAHRLSTLGAPVAVSLGVTTAFDGFLVGLQHQVVDPGTGLGQFSLAFKCPPARKS